MKLLWLAALLFIGCTDVDTRNPGSPADGSADMAAGGSSGHADVDCVQYHFTRVLPGSGLDADMSPDGTVVAVSELEGLHTASTFDHDGRALARFGLDPFTSIVRAVDGGRVLAAASDGRVRRFGPDGTAEWTADVSASLRDVRPWTDGSTVVSGEDDRSFIAFVDAAGSLKKRLPLRAAAQLASDTLGRLELTSRDGCSLELPCGSGFDPNQQNVAPATDPGGSQTSAVLLLDAAGQTSGGFVSNVTDATPFGPLFIKSVWSSSSVVVHAKAMSSERLRAQVDVDPTSKVLLRSLDTEASPDRLLAFSGRELSWDVGFEPLDDSGRAYVVGLFGSSAGVAVDINGDVYKVHHVLRLSPSGATVMRYDKPNSGIADNVRLAGIDDEGRVLLSGWFAGTQDFDPSPDTDLQTATAAARRYVSVISPCSAVP